VTAVAVERGSGTERVLGRPVWSIPVGEPLSALADERVLVTGAAGSIGSALSKALLGIDHAATDVELAFPEFLDVLDEYALWPLPAPTVIFHLAAAKHAPHGEVDPWEVTETNTFGTRNVLAYADSVGARVVFASTCKACDPETAYGASKLIAERMVLNAGGAVARFHNVVETSGNVFEIWRGLDEDAPLPVADCERRFIALEEAVALLLWCAVLPPARYAVNPGVARQMGSVAGDLYPGRPMVAMERRRGDRRREPLAGASESVHRLSEWLLRVSSPHEVAA
jgi:FlaA1/EpsC-like NDP-sugar epimerase